MKLKQVHRDNRPWVETQAELLQRPWNVLIVLDACRADIFRMHHSEAQPVLTMGAPTHAWLECLVAMFPDLHAPYLTANPVVSKELDELEHSFHVHHAWQTISTDLGYMEAPLPGDFTRYIMDFVSAHGQPEKLIVHFLSPHFPFLAPGELPKDEGQIDIAVHGGWISPGQLYDAYRRNLYFAVRAVRDLLRVLRGVCVITADHGEMLGENGRYGHHAVHGTLFDPGLSEVPWWEIHEGDFQPAPLTGPSEKLDEEKVTKRMEELGYM